LDVANENYLSDPIREAALHGETLQARLSPHPGSPFAPTGRRLRQQNQSVRAIDAYADTLDLGALGFTHTDGPQTDRDPGPGQPAFDLAMRLKLYLYGYLNRVRNSRRLECECQRNLELIWLLEGLVPSYRTIAEFRRVNRDALRAARIVISSCCVKNWNF